MTRPYHPEKYWDEVAEQISSRKDLKIIAGDDEPYYRYKRSRFLKLFNGLDFTGKSVLEIGSGPGGNLEVVYSKGAKSVTGSDISSQMVALAKRNLTGKNIDIVKINGRDLPFASNAFDIVFTSTVLQHNPDEQTLKRLIAEICRVSAREIYLFERTERKVTGHESNVGRPISYYEGMLKPYGFVLASKQFLPIQASFFVCGVIRKLLNSKSRREGEQLTKASILLEKIALPVTKLLDELIPSRRDVTFLRFIKV
jgi:SAM-dependent methyltransferase